MAKLLSLQKIEPETHVCKNCGPLPVGEFHKKLGGYQHLCKKCKSKWGREHYDPQRTRENTARVREPLYKQLLEYLARHPCACGEANPVLLDLHHITPKGKSFSISNGIRGGKSWREIRKEIAKCEVLCVRCHRLRTARERGWFRLLGIEE